MRIFRKPVGVCSVSLDLAFRELTACRSVLLSPMILNGIDVKVRLYHLGLSPIKAGS